MSSRSLKSHGSVVVSHHNRREELNASAMKTVEPTLSPVATANGIISDAMNGLTAKHGGILLAKNNSTKKLPHAFHQMNIQHQINVHTAKFGLPAEEEDLSKTRKKKTKIKKEAPKLPSEEHGLSLLKSKIPSISQLSSERPQSGKSSGSALSTRSHINPLLTPILDEDFRREKFEDSLKKSLKDTSSLLEGLQSHRSSSSDLDLTPLSARKKDDIIVDRNTATLEPIKKPSSRGSDSRLLGGTVTTTHSNRAKLCIQTLADGYVDAFEELFSLAHREPVLVDDITDKYFSLSDDKLRDIKEWLVKAESYKRRGKFENVYEIFKQIADYFEGEKDYNTMYYFYDLAESTAKRSSNSALEGLAKENAGKMYERMGQANMAAKYHEAHMSLAHSSGDTAQEERALNQLWRVYVKMAEDSVKQGDLHNACLFYDKSLKNAKQLKDREMTASSLYNLGNIYKEMQDLDKAIEYQQMYTQVCEEMNDKVGKADAYCALGELYEQTQEMDKAIDIYKTYLSLAEEICDDNKIGHACTKLGTVLGMKGEHEDSVRYFERSFELAKRSKDNAKIGEAKVRLGFAKGNANMYQHMMQLKNLGFA
ncbi:hypothetical protein C9374_005285 [Naegleria lovaniensis]|uniref:Tetratricopeptide repeat protein 29 n=1 Tax=Naegleria lovaniensis TaxID=51637 RepID=A0AA88GM08_NAELO|nr:uncharacterized protein C9374_005285 [Naegleria lovaniensis]KAG2382705.1 hypothetical protein C9374_005285 [Naegleria lovaniensis]